MTREQRAALSIIGKWVEQLNNDMDREAGKADLTICLNEIITWTYRLKKHLGLGVDL